MKDLQDGVFIKMMIEERRGRLKEPLCHSWFSKIRSFMKIPRATRI